MTAEPFFRTPPGFDAEFAASGGDALATECFINYGLLGGGVLSAMQDLVVRGGAPSLAAFNVLAVLDGAGQALNPSTIADRLLVSRATTTGVLDSLERHALVRRKTGPADGRTRLVALTAKGARVVRRLVPQVHRFEHDVMACLTPAEQRRLLRLLAKLQAHFPTVAPESRLATPG
jgi:DNA-binding MarR family transcriptional regulator